MYLQPPAILFPPLVPVNRIVFLDWIVYVTERPLTVTVTKMLLPLGNQ